MHNSNDTFSSHVPIVHRTIIVRRENDKCKMHTLFIAIIVVAVTEDMIIMS